MKEAKKKKILHLITDAGSGHKVAAANLTEAIERLNPGKYEQKTMDFFKVIDIEPLNASDASYAFMSRNRAFEAINNIAFRFFNTKVGYSIFEKYITSMLLEEGINVIKDEAPDLVICNHPITATLLNAIKEKHNAFKSVEVVLDLVTIFKGWADCSADLIISPTSEAVSKLVKYGVDVSRIVYPLFPVNYNLSKFRSREEVLKELDFKEELPTILLTAGGVGMKPVEKILRILSQESKYQIIVCAGRLSYFKDKLEKRYAKNKMIRVFGYVDNMQDYYNACDVIVSKPSSATIIEAELFEKLGIWTKNIGEQDAGNIEYVKRNPRFKYLNSNWDDISTVLSDLLSSKIRKPVQEFKRNFNEIDEIVREVLALIE